MAIARTGYSASADNLSTPNTGSIDITVPANTDCLVVYVTGYEFTANIFTGTGAAVTCEGASADAVVTDSDASTSAFMGAAWVFLNPPTGAGVTIAWDWVGTGALDAAARLIWVAYSGVGSIRSATGNQVGSGNRSIALTSTSGDMISVACFGYATSDASATWTNANEVSEYGLEYNSDFTLAERESTGNVTITATVTNYQDGGIMAVVMIPAEEAPVGKTLADSGSGADAQIIAATPSLADSGSGSDVISPLDAALAIAESGAGVDSLSLDTGEEFTGESGEGVDVLVVTQFVDKALADSGSGADAQAIAGAPSISESGSVADAQIIAAALALAETGAGADVLSVVQEVLKALSDSGAGADAISELISTLAAADSGTGTDIISALEAALTIAETGSEADVVSSLQAALALAESGSGDDLLSVIQTAEKILSDSGSGADDLSVDQGATDKELSDSGSGVDVLILAIDLLLSDSGTGVDAQTIQADIFL